MARTILFLVAIMDWHRRYVVAVQITGSTPHYECQLETPMLYLQSLTG